MEIENGQLLAIANHNIYFKNNLILVVEQRLGGSKIYPPLEISFIPLLKISNQ